MARIINGSLTVSSFNATANPGEFTFTNAIFNNQADATGNGAFDLAVGFIVTVQATDPNSASPVPGIVNRYVLTQLTVIDPTTISGTILYDEADFPGTDSPTNGGAAAISQPSANNALGLTPAVAVYPELSPGSDIGSMVVDFQNKVDEFGITGPQGLAGATGASGATGIAGVNGATGLQGVTGVDGQTGIQGVTGIAGVDGVTGIQGATGVRGATGVQGFAGVDGVTGVAGSTGVQGQTGFQGVTGVAGATGVAGQTGTQGTTGVDGATGVDGTPGLQGFQGFTGVQGATGLQGFTGVQGNTGVAGSTGVQGIQGTTGVAGTTGVQGNTGVAGTTGVQGNTGFYGNTGVQGSTGFALNITWNKESKLLNSGDITNQYVDLAFLSVANSMIFYYDGLIQSEGSDYTLSTVGGVTRLTFVGSLATGGSSALVAGDRIYAQYQH